MRKQIGANKIYKKREEKRSIIGITSGLQNRNNEQNARLIRSYTAEVE